MSNPQLPEKPAEDYQDANGTWHIVCGCGHTVTGVRPGTKISLCPNCLFLVRFKPIPVIRADRVEERHL